MGTLHGGKRRFYIRMADRPCNVTGCFALKELVPTTGDGPMEIVILHTKGGYSNDNRASNRATHEETGRGDPHLGTAGHSTKNVEFGATTRGSAG